ncbi:uncharacterized protein LOC111615911 [Centruroides sculpturatus]|uniref:uncharacterized protein LOC111615911 n=1 Tax=Centruroides sculpturatus TaxID=218467 RepID=UPI000C6EC7F2|nr:uncharacterized protein LOC111615911 [Centruroides sculpturatus]
MEGGRRKVSGGPRWCFNFLCLFILSLAAEGQFLESFFSGRRSHDDGTSSDFVDGTSKHFLSLLFSPFDNKQSAGGISEGGGMFSLFGQPSRSGSVNYENYRSPQSSSVYEESHRAYYPCVGCKNRQTDTSPIRPPPLPPRRPDDDYETGAYTCKGCNKGPTNQPIKDISVEGAYECKGCSHDYSAQAESYRSPKRYQESYEYPKIHHHPQYHVIDTKLRVPPIKFRLHLSPKITIKTNAQDPLERKPVQDDEDYIPPEVHHHHHHHGHHVHGYYHPKRDGSGVHIEQPYGAHFIKHNQPIRNKYDPTFRIKIDPEIFTDPPPSPSPPTPRTTTSSSRLEARPSRQSAAATTRATTTTTTTTTPAPTISSNARSAIDSLREASESGLSPLEALLRRRSTTTKKPSTTTSTTTVSTTTTSQREVEETTAKTTTTIENVSSNEVSVDTVTSTTPVSEKIQVTTQDPRVAILKLREAAESGRNPFEALLAARRTTSNDRKLNPRNSEKN